MRQRNDTPYELFAPVDPPLVIAPGEIVEYEHPLTGCTVIEDDEKPTPKAKPDDKASADATKNEVPAQ